MGKYFGPVLVIVLSLLVAGAWVLFPQERKSACSAVSSVLSSFAAEAKAAWSRHMTKASDDDKSPVKLVGWEYEEPDLVAAVETASNAVDRLNLPASDPDPSSLTPEQRKRKYNELVAAAKARKMEVMRVNLMKCPNGQEAFTATRAYHAKLEEMKRLEEKYGQTDDRVTAIRIEIVALKEAVQVANVRYKAWKDAHPNEVTDPLANKVYRDLVSRSRFYRD